MSGQTAYKEWQRIIRICPSNPNTYIPYQKHWKGWTHFLGNEKLPWEEGLKKVQDAKLSGQTAYKEWQKDHPDMPSHPDKYIPYQKHWKGLDPFSRKRKKRIEIDSKVIISYYFTMTIYFKAKNYFFQIEINSYPSHKIALIQRGHRHCIRLRSM